MTDEALYHDLLVRLAREGSGAGRLAAPDGSGTRDSPLCGDQVTVEVRLEGGRIVALAHRTRGCLLCQAAASLLGRAAPGATVAEVAAARAAAAAILEAGAPPPPPPWEALGHFAPVRAVPSRHACVLLPFEALADALAGARR